jgi:Domain of unknown function (DUF4136)
MVNLSRFFSGVAGVSRLLRAGIAVAAVALLAACASPITAKVTSFNSWPANAAGATYSFAPSTAKPSELEQAAYEGYVGAELQRIGLKQAAPGQTGRFLVDVTASGTTRNRTYLQPIYDHNWIWYPPYRDRNGNVFQGYWGPDPWGPRWVGDRQVTRTVQVGRLQVRLLDSQIGGPGKAKPVFESTAVYEGDNEDLPDLVPYLARAALDGFPGQNGGVRVVKFDPSTGQLVRK